MYADSRDRVDCLINESNTLIIFVRFSMYRISTFFGSSYLEEAHIHRRDDITIQSKRGLIASDGVIDDAVYMNSIFGGEQRIL